jgi:putative PEP-CTERM system histidine kinase
MAAGVASFSYGVAALAFAALALWLTMVRPARMHDGLDGTLFAGAAALTALWSAMLAWQAYAGQALPVLIEAAELLRSGGWSLVLLRLSGLPQRAAAAPPWRRPALLLGAAYAVVAVLTLLPLSRGVYLAFYWAVLLRLVLAVGGMLLVEQLYRNRPPGQRWSVKFVCIGAGGMFVYDFYMYSDAMLLHALDTELWGARGVVNALTAPLLAVAARRGAATPRPQQPLESQSQLALSRPALMHSATLLGAACYLLAMGAAAWYLRYVGGNWGAMMQLAFLFAAALLLAGILFSGSARGNLRVFINKHFYRYRYDYREEWLRLTRTLSEPGPDLGSRCIEAVANMVDSPAGALWLRDERGVCRPAGHWNMPLPDAGASEAGDSAFCRFIEEKQWLVDVRGHTPEDEGGVSLPPLPAWLAALPRAWLLLPLILDGKLLGFVLLLQSRSGVPLNWETIDLLKTAGSQIASYLAQREAAAALALARQFDSFNRMSTFVVHDLKNLVSQLSLLLSNAERHRDNPAFQRDMLETVDFAAQKMRRLLQKLSRISGPERIVPLAMEALLRQAVALKSALEPVPVVHVEQAGLHVAADPERLERVLGHLIQNAIEATPRHGAVTVRLASEDGAVLVEVSDSGCGMSADFIRERLFQPFDSTKPAGMGIGAFESREYIVELGGRLDVRSAEGQGTTFRLTLPAWRDETSQRQGRGGDATGDAEYNRAARAALQA